jgi:uncharacterized protein involved in exopolysaccharide biosynthesis
MNRMDKEDIRLVIAERQADINRLQAQIDPLEKRKAELFDDLTKWGLKLKELDAKPN